MNPIEGESNQMKLPFESLREQEEPSGGLLPPAPPARYPPTINGGNPWAADAVGQKIEEEGPPKCGR